jgi:hypothetical protein
MSRPSGGNAAMHRPSSRRDCRVYPSPQRLIKARIDFFSIHCAHGSDTNTFLSDRSHERSDWTFPRVLSVCFSKTCRDRVRQLCRDRRVLSAGRRFPGGSRQALIFVLKASVSEYPCRRVARGKRLLRSNLYTIGFCGFLLRLSRLRDLFSLCHWKIPLTAPPCPKELGPVTYFIFAETWLQA